MALMLPGAEYLAMPIQPGFVVGHKETAQNGSIEERVPQGETVDDWTRIVTLIRLNSPIAPSDYIANFTTGLRRNCPGASAEPPTPAKIGIHAALASRLDCPLNPQTGKPEVLFYRVFSAGGALFMTQVSFRYAPSGRDIAWAYEQIGGARLCGGVRPDPGC